MLKKILLSTTIVILFLLGLKLLLPKTAVVSNTSVAHMTATKEPVKAVGFEYADLIKQSLKENRSLATLAQTHIGITSHHLPTASSLIAQFYNTLQASGSPKKFFVIIGPDHYEHCKHAASTTDRDYYTPFGILPSNAAIINDLKENGGVAEVDDCFDGEHSIGVHAMYVKYLYPNATIVPITYSSAAKDEDIQKVVDVLAKHKDEITIIVSVDFNHYQSAEKANQLDAESGDMIRHMDGSGLSLKYMDSPASIKTAIAFAKAIGEPKPQFLLHKNSYDFTGQSENTTGYYDIFFTP